MSWRDGRPDWFVKATARRVTRGAVILDSSQFFKSVCCECPQHHTGSRFCYDNSWGGRGQFSNRRFRFRYAGISLPRL